MSNKNSVPTYLEMQKDLNQTVDLIKHRDLSHTWLCVDLRLDTKTKRVLQKDWTTCSSYSNHSKVNKEHNLKGSIRPLNEHKNIHFGIE